MNIIMNSDTITLFNTLVPSYDKSRLTYLKYADNRADRAKTAQEALSVADMLMCENSIDEDHKRFWMTFELGITHMILEKLKPLIPENDFEIEKERFEDIFGFEYSVNPDETYFPRTKSHDLWIFYTTALYTARRCTNQKIGDSVEFKEVLRKHTLSNIGNLESIRLDECFSENDKKDAENLLDLMSSILDDDDIEEDA